MIQLPDSPRVLVVDDEPDVLAVTRLSLKGIKYGGRPVEIVGASSGKEAVASLAANPLTAVVLLDVVMETPSAGLDACREIRNGQGNRLVRILLRTGQPGAAPERKVIEEYDIDGYLPKAELSSNRLFVAVRTALKAFSELVELERTQQALQFLHQAVLGLSAFEPLEISMERVLATALGLSPSSLGVLMLETMNENGEPRRWLLHSGSQADTTLRARAAQDVVDRVTAAAARGGTMEDGFLAPIALHRELGNGWLFLEGAVTDPLARRILPVLAAHAGNALYATVAQEQLRRKEAPLFETYAV